MGSFEKNGFSFAVDREGLRLEGGEPIEIEIEYEDLLLDFDRAPEMIGARLSRLMGERVEDDEGIFDLVVSQRGKPVAALVISCEEDAVELAGERLPEVSDDELAETVLELLHE